MTLTPQPLFDKHTPGPWHFETDREDMKVIIDSEYFRICELNCLEQGYVRRASFEANCANARLIASAPDMLVALEAVIKRHYSGQQERDATEIIVRAAIAMARGGQ